MTQSNSTSWAWLSPRYLTDAWHPELFRPEYLALDREIELSDYQPLRELVEVTSSPPVDLRKGKWHVDSEEIRRRILSVESETVLPVAELPDEAIIISRHWRHKPSVHYWNEKLFRGRGTASNNVWILKSRTSRSIAWLHQELLTDKGLLQLQRAAIGNVLPYLPLDLLLNIRVRRLPLDLEERENYAVRDNAIDRISELRAKSLRKPFILTGRTFEERLTQFEQYLEFEGLFSRSDAFFAEPATNNKASDLFTVRPIRSSNVNEAESVHLVSQDDPAINEKWRSWFWDSSELETHRVFNTIVTDDEIPPFLLIRTIAKPCPCVPTNNKCIVPRFSVFRESVLPSIQAGVDVDDQVWSSAWIELQKAAGFPIARKANDVNSKSLLDSLHSYQLSEDLFAWARSIYRPVLAIKVRREDSIVGVYLLFGDDQTSDYATAYSKLDDIGIMLADILTPPSQLIEDVARRESLRRLSWVMHQLNGPVGRASNALEDIQEFLSDHDEIGCMFVPDEEKANRRSRMPGGASLDRQTLSARLRDAIKAMTDVRKITYQVRQLKRVQGDLPKVRFEFMEILQSRCSACRERLPELLLELDGPPVVYAVGNAESISAAIEEVLSNSCRELKERKVMSPKIVVRSWKGNEEIWFSIQDNALPADISLITNPFEEDASTYAQSGRGSGLGLAIVRETFLAHGGGCSLEPNINEEGRKAGVTFIAHFSGGQ